MLRLGHCKILENGEGLGLLCNVTYPWLLQGSEWNASNLEELQGSG